MADLLSWFKKKSDALYHGLSPFDHGQGWSSRPPRIPPRRPIPPPQFLQRPQFNNQVLNNRSPVQIGRQQVQSPQQHRPVTPYHPPNIAPLVQPFTRAVPNLGVSIADALKPGRQQFNPKPGIQQKILGKEPITSYQRRQAGLQKALQGSKPPPHANLEQQVIAGLRKKLAGPLSVAGTAFNAGTDATIAAPGLKLAGKGVKVATKGIKLPKATAYHASPANIKGQLRSSADGMMGPGVYLHTNPETAKLHSAMQGDGNIADQVAHKAKIPNKVYNLSDNNYPNPGKVASIRKSGYNGVSLKGGETVVFDPNKVKLSGHTPLNQEGKLRLPNLGGHNQSFHYTSPTKGYTKLSGKANDVRAQLTKLNEVGAVGKNVPSEDELKYSHAFGVSPEQARKELADLNKQQSITASRQMKKPQGVGVPQGVKNQLQPKVPFKRGSVDNTKLNPMRVEAPEVKPGDYGQARLRPGAVSRPIEFSAGQTVNSLKKLNPSEKTKFWQAVENPKMANTPKLKDAVTRWTDLSNRVHATSQALGGNTNYVGRYARHNWDLTDPKMAKKYEELVNKRGGAAIDPYNFSGLNSQNRAFSSITEGKAAGFKLKNPGDPEQDVIEYANSATGTLRKQALSKAIHEADVNAEGRALSMNISDSQQIEGLSPQAMHEIKAFERHEASTNKAVRGIRTVNQAAKTTILSGGQFHPVNISLLRAGPSTALAGHPIAAAKGMARTFRPLLPGGKGAVDRVMQHALEDGMVEKAAKIGAPYGQAGYNVEGTALKSGVGHKLVFERQMPMMHDQVVRSVIKDLEKKGIPLDSEEARQAGIAANATMGFINKEALNISPRVRQGMSDVMLASQFTPSKVITVGKVAKRGVAGKYARSDVASNVIAATTLITGVGFLLGQKSDSIRDSLLRALVNPAIPTPWKDKKGNNIELRVPLTYTGEVSKILGLKLKRNPDGHLGVEWKPSETLSAHGGLAEWMRSRLGPVPSTAVKIATNTNFADKPLYDPNAPAGKKAIQAGTTIGQGLLPIGTQGIPNSEFVKNHVPGSAKEILEANTPGSNPVLKGAVSSVGFSARTDQTTGKGLDSSRYFNALNDAKKGLNDHEKAALELYAGSKKNPVTGKYDVTPNVHDSSAKAKALLDQPKVIGKLIDMNRRIKKDGGKTDPLWSSSSDQVKKVLEYQTMPPGGADKDHWYTQNKGWYEPLSKARTKFFNSLPKGDPNKPAAPLEYPKPPMSTEAKKNQFFKITDSVERAKYIKDNPDLQKHFDDLADYTNNMREAQGYSKLDNYPKSSPRLDKLQGIYNALPKHDGPKGGSKTRSIWIKNHPKEFSELTRYWTQVSLYGLEQDAGQAQFQDTGFSSKGLGDIYNIGRNDVKKGQDKAGKPAYALTTGQSGGAVYADQNGNTFADIGQANSSGYSSSSSSGGRKGFSSKGYSTSRYSRTRKPKGVKVSKPNFSSKGFKTAKPKKLSAPKGVKVKKLNYKSSAPKTRKLSVSKIPTTYKGKKV